MSTKTEGRAVICAKCKQVAGIAFCHGDTALIQSRHVCPPEQPIDADAFDREMDRLLDGKPRGQV